MKEIIEIHYYSEGDLPNIDKIIKRDGKKYKVIENAIRYVTIAELVEE